MRLKKWYVGMLSSLLLLCLTVFPAMATEADVDTDVNVATEVIEETESDEETGEASVADEEADGTFMEEESEMLLDTEGSDGNVEETDALSLNKNNISLSYVEVTEQLTATVTEGYSISTINWSSKNTNVATVDQNGNVQAVTNGNAVIQATVDIVDENGNKISLTAECDVSVDLVTGIRKDVTDTTQNIYYYVNGAVYYDEAGNATVQKDYRKVVDDTASWWYIDANGVVDTKGEHTDCFAKNQNGWWYIENGKVTFLKNSVIKDKDKVIDGAATWWYVVGSKVKTDFTGLADYSNQNGWWYIENGKVTFTKNTVAKNKNGWWYVTDSKVQFGFTGLSNYSNANGWWYIKNGKVDFSKNTVAKNKNGWWYVTGGKVQFGYTGLANYSNANGWWYIKNGKVDFTYEGVAKNKNGYWYVNGGKVIFEDALTYAARFVAAHSTEGASSYDRLSECYKYIQSIYSYKRYYGIPTSSDLFSYAEDYFVNKTGNCYRYASSFACIAKVLGFESRMVSGKRSNSSGGWTSHGWAEVKYNGTWYICDMNFKVFMKTESGHPYNLKVLNRYTLTVSNGKATWK